MTAGRLDGEHSIAPPSVRRVGLGCMGMSFAYQADPDSDSPADVIAAAIRTGAPDARVLLDTADVYGPATNEEFVGAALAQHGVEGVCVATKGGLVAPDGDAFRAQPCGRPDHLRAAVDASLLRLGIDRIDLYQLHRVDPEVPLSETWSALADLVAVGKIASLGICTLDVGQLEAAHAIHPVAAVQWELSLIETRPLAEVVPWCERNGASFIAYGPLTRGLFAGGVAPGTAFAESDIRSRLPSFSLESVYSRRPQIDAIRLLADRVGMTAAQLVLGRLLQHSPSIVAIPGTRRVSRWLENAATPDDLSPEIVAELDDLLVPTSAGITVGLTSSTQAEEAR